MGKWEHSISGVDEDSRTGVCSSCGEVEVRFRSYGGDRGGVWRCAEVLRQRKRAYKSRRRHGLDIQATLVAQDGKCAICDSPFGDDPPNVDHCHVTGRGRGLLCRNCNLGLGFFKDSIPSLERAISYLGTP